MSLLTERIAQGCQRLRTPLSIRLDAGHVIEGDLSFPLGRRSLQGQAKHLLNRPVGVAVAQSTRPGGKGRRHGVAPPLASHGCRGAL